MESNIKKQKGFLLVAAVVLIVIMSFVGMMLVQTFTTGTKAITNVLQSKQALYIAISGLEIAKRDITVNNVACIAINGSSKYTNAPLFNGQFTVTGSTTATSSTLASNIASGSTTIPLNNASSFSNEGVVQVDSELIGYMKKSGNSLLEVTRGKTSTPISAHSGGSTVVQNQCVLTSVGGVPTINTPEGKRIVQQVLLGSSFSLGSYRSPITAVGSVTIAGSSSIINTSATINGDGYPGSTIVSGSTVSITGSATTKVSDGLGGLVTSSDKNTTEADIVENYTNITSANLFSYYFSQSKSVIKAGAYQSYDKNNIDGVTGKTIWIDGNLGFTGSGDITIGSPTAPVILIVDGNFTLGGSKNIAFYGFLYATGNIKMTGSGDFSGMGAMATEGTVSFTGSKTKNLDPGILDILPHINPNTTIHYAPNPVSFYEVF